MIDVPIPAFVVMAFMAALGFLFIVFSCVDSAMQADRWPDHAVIRVPNGFVVQTGEGGW